jgi:hypothetical protein
MLSDGPYPLTLFRASRLPHGTVIITETVDVMTPADQHAFEDLGFARTVQEAHAHAALEWQPEPGRES